VKYPSPARISYGIKIHRLQEELGISAKQLSRKQRKEGNLTKEEFDRINRKADKVLKKAEQ